MEKKPSSEIIKKMNQPHPTPSPPRPPLLSHQSDFQGRQTLPPKQGFIFIFVM